VERGSRSIAAVHAQYAREKRFSVVSGIWQKYTTGKAGRRGYARRVVPAYMLSELRGGISDWGGMVFAFLVMTWLGQLLRLRSAFAASSVVISTPLKLLVCLSWWMAGFWLVGSLYEKYFA